LLPTAAFAPLAVAQGVASFSPLYDNRRAWPFLICALALQFAARQE
jgi:hypothetical protein